VLLASSLWPQFQLALWPQLWPQFANGTTDGDGEDQGDPGGAG